MWDTIPDAVGGLLNDGLNAMGKSLDDKLAMDLQQAQTNRLSFDMNFSSMVERQKLDDLDSWRRRDAAINTFLTELY